MDSVIMARPTYVTTLTNRFDPYRNSGVIRGREPIDMEQTAMGTYKIQKIQENDFIKNVPKSYIFYKKKLSSANNNNMSQFVMEPIDEPLLDSSQYSKVGVMNNGINEKREKESFRPDLSYTGAQLPKLGIENKFKDPTDPTNYMYDRTLFAPLKRRNGGNQTDFIRGDIYVAPNRFGWFDVPSNPGTDLNPGFFNLNYPSYEETTEGQDTKVERKNQGITMAELEAIQRNNPFSTNFLHRP